MAGEQSVMTVVGEATFEIGTMLLQGGSLINLGGWLMKLPVSIILSPSCLLMRL